MKTLLAVGISIIVAIGLMFALREYMPGALLIVGAAAFVVAYVVKSVKADPQRGWPTLAVLATVGFMLTGFFLMVGGPWPLALGALFFLGLAIFCAAKWARLGRTASGSGSAGKKFDTLAQAHELSRAAELDRRRSKARGEMLRAQEGEIQAQQKIRELEAANAALRQKVKALERDLDEAINDPVFDQSTHPLYKHAT